MGLSMLPAHVAHASAVPLWRQPAWLLRPGARAKHAAAAGPALGVAMRAGLPSHLLPSLPHRRSQPRSPRCPAAVMAACAQQADYGKQRLWGAIGWGICSALAGAAISHAGIWAAFASHAALALVAAAPTARLPFGPLHAKLDSQAGKLGGRAGCEAAGGSEGAAVGAGGQPGGSSKQAVVERFDSAAEAHALLAGSKPGPRTGAGAGGGGGGQAGGRGEAEAAPPPQVRFWSGVAQLLSNPEAAVFFSQALLMGFGVGNIEGFLFLYLDELGEQHVVFDFSFLPVSKRPRSQPAIGVPAAAACHAREPVWFPRLWRSPRLPPTCPPPRLPCCRCRRLRAADGAQPQRDVRG